jgi:hypothetical protein
MNDFELWWQNGTWGLQEGEEWDVTGDLFDILGTIKTKWANIL